MNSAPLRLKIKKFPIYFNSQTINSTFSRSFPSSNFLFLSMNFSSSSAGPVESSIYRKLSEKFSPAFLSVENESKFHNVPKDSETHFKVIVVSSQFSGQSLVQRHRSVNYCLEAELKGGVHALSIAAKTEEQWKENQKIEPSPKCMGGEKKN